MTQTIINELNPDDLREWMHPETSVRIIEFYASWCIYHQLTRRKLERFALALAEQGFAVHAGAIDALGNEDSLRSVGIHQIPCIGCYWKSQSLLWIGDTDLDVMLEDFVTTLEPNLNR